MKSCQYPLWNSKCPTCWLIVNDWASASVSLLITLLCCCILCLCLNIMLFVLDSAEELTLLLLKFFFFWLGSYSNRPMICNYLTWSFACCSCPCIKPCWQHDHWHYLFKRGHSDGWAACVPDQLLQCQHGLHLPSKFWHWTSKDFSKYILLCTHRRHTSFRGSFVFPEYKLCTFTRVVYSLLCLLCPYFLIPHVHVHTTCI